MTQNDIIQGCIELNPKYQRALVGKYSTKLYTVSRRYCIDDHQAKDALQEGLIRIFKNISRFDPSRGGFEPWMKKIVANESLRIIKRNGFGYFTDISEIEIPDHNRSPFDNLHEEEIISLIRQLPSGYREVFNMYVIDGYDHKEISEKLGITPGTSRSQLARARKILRVKHSKLENYQPLKKVNH